MSGWFDWFGWLVGELVSWRRNVSKLMAFQRNLVPKLHWRRVGNQSQVDLRLDLANW